MQLVPDLRARGAEIVIALCHQREIHDKKLAEKTPRGLIDIILGGHDHHCRWSKYKDTHILCSGSDFKQLSYIEARRWKVDDPTSLFHAHRWDISIARRDIVSSIPEDPATLELMDQLFASVKVKLEKAVGYTSVPLDSRFTTVRTRESNIGNFACDLMRYYYDTDCGIMSGGTIRGDVIYPPGVLRLKDIMDWFVTWKCATFRWTVADYRKQFSIRRSDHGGEGQGTSNPASLGEWCLPLSRSGRFVRPSQLRCGSVDNMD